MKALKIQLTGMFFLWIFTQCESSAGGTGSADSLQAISFSEEEMFSEVEVALAAEKVFIQEIETNGSIQALLAADAVWETGGIIDDVRVRNGQWVEKGQVLALLENRKEKLQLKKAEIALKEKQISYESESLGADSLRQQYLEYHTGLAMTEVMLEEAELAFDQTMLKAPISGIINGLFISVGTKAQLGAAFCHIWNPEQLEFVGFVMETQLNSLQKGQKAVIRPLGSQESYPAVLQGKDSRIDENGLVQIRLRLQNSKGLLPGRNAKAYIQIPHQQAVVIPKPAVVMRSGKPVVFTYAGGLAKWNEVSLGIENGSEVEIVEGLQQGDSIITANNLQLAHDARVKIAKD